MKHSQFVLWLITVCILAGSVAMGQDQSGGAIKAPQADLVSLSFAGGDVGAYVAALKKSAGPVNIFVAPEAREVPVPAVDLKDVSLAAALHLLNDRVANVDRRDVKLIYASHFTNELGEQPIHVIRASFGRSASKSPYNRIWSVANIVGSDVKAEDLLTAIETSLDMLSKGEDYSAAQIRFHEATGVLIARATEEQLQSIQEVIENVERAAMQRRDLKTPPALKDELAKRDHRIKELQDRIAELESRLGQKTGN